jgi:hypothetical protein
MRGVGVLYLKLGELEVVQKLGRVPHREIITGVFMEDVRTLIRENILPRLDNLDAEMYELRRSTWPICQGQRDTAVGGPLTNIRIKARFLKFFHVDVIRDLLIQKALAMGIYSQTVVDEELRQILVFN